MGPKNGRVGFTLGRRSFRKEAALPPRQNPCSFLKQIVLQQNRKFNKYFTAHKNGSVTFLFPNKKVTKEVGIGEALSSALPRRKPPSPMYLTRRALGNPVLRIDQNLQVILAKRWRRLRSRRPADFVLTNTSRRKSEHFLLEQELL